MNDGTPCSHVVPPCKRSITMGDVVEASFRLLDVMPFTVRQDMARLINLYMHDPVGYMDKRSDLFPRLSPRGPTGPAEPLPDDPAAPVPLSP